MAGRNLKARNAPLTGAFVALNALTILAITLPEWRMPTPLFDALPPQVDEWFGRVGLTAAATIALTVLNNLIPSDWKAVLVFWKLRDVLPGHRAFSWFARKDARINVQKLMARIKEWPTSARDQNAKWYALLRQHEAAPHIGAGHRVFLLLRDMSALTVLLASSTPATSLAGATWSAIAWVEVALVIEFLALSTAGRNAGNRLVVNVLAHECAQP